MKQLFKKLLFVFACTLLLTSLKPAQANAETYFNVKSAVNSKYQVTLKWKKQSCSQVRIYREQITPTGTMKQKLIKTLKGNATTFTDKKTKKKIAYNYYVKAYKKVNGKYVLKASGNCMEYCGLIKPDYDDYFAAEGPYTATSIQLKFGISCGMTPNGYQIQRKVGNGSYKTVKTLKTTKRSTSWNNTGLKTGTKYTYRIRSYKKIGKKTVYSNWSQAYSRIAALRFGKYTGTEFIIPETANGEFALTIISDSTKNAPIDFSNNLNKSDGYGTCEYAVTKVYINGLKKDAEKDSLNIKADGNIKVVFTSTDLYNYLKDATHTNGADIAFGAMYNGTPVILTYNTKTQVITVEMDSESIH